MVQLLQAQPPKYLSPLHHPCAPPSKDVGWVGLRQPSVQMSPPHLPAPSSPPFMNDNAGQAVTPLRPLPPRPHPPQIDHDHTTTTTTMTHPQRPHLNGATSAMTITTTQPPQPPHDNHHHTMTTTTTTTTAGQ